MTVDDLSQKISVLSRRLEGLEAEFSSSSANAPKILADALESLHASIEELLVAEKVIKQQGEECIKSAEESTDYQALVHSLQVHQIELEMQNEELKRSKLETEEALSKYYDIYDFSPIGLFTLDPKGHIIEANLTGATLLGMARGSIMNKRFRQFIVPKDRWLFDGFYKKALESSVKETCELCLLKNGGSQIYVRAEGIATLDPSMNEKRFRIAIIDVTESKRAKEALLESEEQFRRAVEDAPIPMIMHAEDGQVLQVSRTWTELTGYTQTDISTFDAWLNQAYGEGADSVRDYMQKLFQGDQRTIKLSFPSAQATVRSGIGVLVLPHPASC